MRIQVKAGLKLGIWSNIHHHNGIHDASVIILYIKRWWDSKVHKVCSGKTSKALAVLIQRKLVLKVLLFQCVMFISTTFTLITSIGRMLDDDIHPGCDVANPVGHYSLCKLFSDTKAKVWKGSFRIYFLFHVTGGRIG